VRESPWEPGAHILLRSIWQGWLWFAFPAIVVHDQPDLIALWTPAGTRFAGGLGLDGRPTRLPLPDMRHTELVIRDAGVLRLARPGAAHDVWVRWSPDGATLLDWKVNLQEPLRRGPLGFDTCDHFLDLMIAPDLSSWHWKDADELDEAVGLGRFSAKQADEIRAEGDRALEAVQTRGWPYADGWETWAPPAGWGIPSLPDDWDRI
jgi:hypothetical protein